jgi:hypothetical protein
MRASLLALHHLTDQAKMGFTVPTPAEPPPNAWTKTQFPTMAVRCSSTCRGSARKGTAHLQEVA